MLHNEKSAFIINQKSRQQAMTIAGKYFLGSHLVSIRLQAPTIDGYSRKQAIASTGMSTKESHNTSYLTLAKDAMLAFDVTLIAPIVYTSHSHELMALANGRAHSFTSEFTVYANMTSIKSTESSFLGEAIDLDALHSLIKLFWKQSQKERTSENWRLSKGQYQVHTGKDNKGKAIWTNYQLPASKPEIQPETENLAPIVADELPASYVTDITQAHVMAHRENQARAKAEKQAKAKAEFNS